MFKKKHTVLVAGGAGFIGSHMVSLLLAKGYDVIVLDNLSTGHQDAIRGGTLVMGDLSDTALLESIFQQHDIVAVLHFAASLRVGESVVFPEKYYDNNVVNTLNLLSVMREYRVKHFIFSSSAAVYGEPRYLPIDEKHEKSPVNPYGRTKWIVALIGSLPS